ncbi:MAG: uroporphyrinogen decarboxylase [Ignavibacteria bacterium]|nr:uroporphyrinogen decarboxylase [Ignavibacteria bacterium]
MNHLQNDLILRAAKRQKVERVPIWIMRQAGRYLPEYRKVREKVSFLELCKTPELAAEVTIQPVDIIGVDAAIIFSDILVVPEAMGMKLSIDEGKGPIIHDPISDLDSINKLRHFDPEVELKYVLDAIKLTKKELKNRVPLIGFSGAPWTLLTYMVEGKTSKNFSKVKSFIFNNRELAHHALNLITDCVVDYLFAQIKAGADLIQIFDSWAGVLAPHHFEEFSFYYLSKIVEEIKPKYDVPIILFAKGANHSIEKLAYSGCDVVGLDWTIDIKFAKERIGSLVTIQGNMDPAVLYGNQQLISSEADKILNAFSDNIGLIFNLGHGIYPDIDPEKLKFLVSYIKEKSFERSEKEVLK